ncbi:MAG: hypothetical protein HY313_01265 [Acidobacteria bacterium]|nr:hypothetical protein [Acidobacteriota bacterium]
MSHLRMFLLLSVFAGFLSLAQSLAQTQPAAQSPKTKDAKIQNAMSAAPSGIAKAAAIADFPQTPGGPMAELRKGTNGWTCLPDMADTPMNDPMCVDKVAMQFMEAWMAKKDPKLTGLGMGYMLQGGATADNDDPFAMKPKAGKDWLREPPHIMVFGAKLVPGVYSNTPNMAGPWVMWKGTPYEHLMVPVK